MQTRDGLLRAALPQPIGTCVFANDLDADQLDRMLAVHKELVPGLPAPAATARTCSPRRPTPPDATDQRTDPAAGHAARRSWPSSSAGSPARLDDASTARGSRPGLGDPRAAALAAGPGPLHRRLSPRPSRRRCARSSERTAAEDWAAGRGRAGDRPGAGDALGPRRGPDPEDAGARHPGHAGSSRSACSPATPRWRWPRRLAGEEGRRRGLRDRRLRRRARAGVLRRLPGRRPDRRTRRAGAGHPARAGRRRRGVRPGLRRRRQGGLRRLLPHAARRRRCWPPARCCASTTR